MKVVKVRDQIAFKSEKMNSDKIYYLLEGKGKVTIGSIWPPLQELPSPFAEGQTRSALQKTASL
ncbi:hypothetical protein GWN26_06650 [Candidatus Saccharibacteria bacterium]|nr:hypothetical protein [Calditrichia bacterium]NIV98835.1 hypothetical protein [Candidatus Saccharibacteria bacterium]